MTFQSQVEHTCAKRRVQGVNTFCNVYTVMIHIKCCKLSIELLIIVLQLLIVPIFPLSWFLELDLRFRAEGHQKRRVI